MKKLMFVAVLAAGFAAFGDGNGIESANTVGYYAADTAFRAGNTMYCPVFSGIGAAEYSVQDIIPKAVSGTVPNGSVLSSAITIQKLTATGASDGGLWYWMDYYDEDEEDDFYGWWNSGLSKKCTHTFKAGEAFWTKMPGNNVTLQFAGEVTKGNAYMLLRQGNTAVGNPTPTTISVQDIIPVGTAVPNGSVLSSAITLQKLTATGASDGGLWYWMDYYDEDEEDDFYGWWNSGLSKKCTHTFAPGEGMWVKCSNATTSLQFPAAIAE